MKSISKYISSALMMAACACAFTSCDDWTDPEHIDLNYGTIDTSDPAAYEKYLANLREYRQLPHKQVYAWFDNVETAFGSQGHRVSALPDSIDVIVLNNPEKVTDQMVQDMYHARVNKGQQFSFSVSLDDINADYTTLCEELAAKRNQYTFENGADAPIPAELKDPDQIRYIIQSTKEKLEYFNAVGFDAVMAGFVGKSQLHMTPFEISEYKDQVGSFLGTIEDWISRNPEVTVDFIGRPQYVESDLLKKVRYAFLSDALAATNTNMYSICLIEAGDALPESQIGMVAPIPGEGETGIFSNGQLAVNGVAEWTAAHSVGAVGIQNAGQDYFLTTGKYTDIRELIQIVNPSAK